MPSILAKVIPTTALRKVWSVTADVGVHLHRIAGTHLATMELLASVSGRVVLTNGAGPIVCMSAWGNDPLSSSDGAVAGIHLALRHYVSTVRIAGIVITTESVTKASIVAVITSITGPYYLANWGIARSTNGV